MAKSKEPKILTRKHLVRAEREHRQQRILILTIIGFVVIVFGLIAYGLLDQYAFTPDKPVAKVDGQNISVKDFNKYAVISRVQYINQYNQLQQYASIYQQFGLTLDASLQNQINQITYVMSDPKILGQNVLTTMIDNVILKNQAEKLGIKVSDDEVTKTLQESYGFYLNGTPTPASTPTTYLEPTLSKTQQELLITPTSTPDLTATATQPPAPTATEGATPTTIPPTAAPTVNGPTSTPENTPTPQPTPTPLTLAGFNADLKTYMTSLAAFGVNENDYRAYVKTQLLNNKIYKEITKDVPTHGEQVWMRDILVSNELDAQSIVARIKNGDNFIAIASSLSQDTSTKANGGDLGWFPKGIRSAEVEAASFGMNIGEIKVVQDLAGWHVLQMVSKATDRPFSQSVLNQLQSIAYTAWHDPIKNAAKVETFNIWQTNVPVAPVLPTQAAQ